MSEVPPELAGFTSDELRFHRLIEEREMQKDGTQEIELACGHRIIMIIPIPDEQQYMQCAQCVNAWVDAERKRPL